jgi:DUF2934 family protein
MLDPVELKNEIRCRAYGLYEQRGRTDGFALDDWLQAQTEFLEELLQEQSELTAGT